MRSFDTVVIGGGIVGLTTALAFADEGASVLLLERGDTAREASWAGAGILFPIYPWRYPEAVQRMAQRGRALHGVLSRRVFDAAGMDIGLRSSGLFLLDQFSEAEQWAQRHEESILPYAWQQQMGQLLPDVAQVRNPRLCQGLALLLKGVGVDIRSGEPVQRVYSRGNRPTLQLQSGSVVQSSICVVCTGAWSSELLPGIPIEPVKGQMLLLEDEPGIWPHIVLDGGRYLVPRDDGRLLIGSSVEHAGFDKHTDEQTIAGLREHFASRFPRLAGLTERARWAGLRPALADGLPVVAPVREHPGLYVNTGHFRNGLTMAPAAAELMLKVAGLRNTSPLAASDYDAAVSTITSSL